MEPEPRLDVPAGLAVVEALLNDLGRLAVAGQPLARPVAQNDDTTHIEFVPGSLSTAIDEPTIAKSRPQDLAS